MRYLFLFFILIPFVEIFILIAVSHEIGLFVTVNLVLFTAIVGTFFLRKQGLKTLFRARERIYAGEIPAKEMIEAIIISSRAFFSDRFKEYIPGRSINSNFCLPILISPTTLSTVTPFQFPTLWSKFVSLLNIVVFPQETDPKNTK